MNFYIWVSHSKSDTLKTPVRTGNALTSSLSSHTRGCVQGAYARCIRTYSDCLSGIRYTSLENTQKTYLPTLYLYNIVSPNWICKEKSHWNSWKVYSDHPPQNNFSYRGTTLFSKKVKVQKIVVTFSKLASTTYERI